MVIATVPQLESEAGQLQGALEDGLGRNRVVARWGELVGTDPAAYQAAEKLRQLIETSFKACSATVSPGEGSKADEAVAALAAAAPAITPQDVQKAYASVSATRWTANNPANSESAANKALAIDPGLAAPQVMIPPGYEELWERSRFSAKDRARKLGRRLERSPRSPHPRRRHSPRLFAHHHRGPFRRRPPRAG